MEKFKCSVEGCDGLARAKGLCKKHHTRLLRHGDPSVRLTPEGCDPNRICGVPGCGRPLRAKGLCMTHYERQARGLPMDAPIAVLGAPKAKCSIDGCDGVRYSNGLCERHYWRQRRHGDPTVKLRPEGRQRCSVDGCDRDCSSGGLCKLHARRLRATGDPLKATIHREPGRICAVEGCGEPYAAKGLCRVHYHRQLNRAPGESLDSKRPVGGNPVHFLEDALKQETDECIRWPYHCKGGYARISLHHGLGQNVCRIICERVHGPAPSPEHHASHICGDGHKGCINPRHLIWETPAENMARKKTHKGDRGGRGSRHSLAKLTEDNVREIRTMLPTMLQKDIASHFGVDKDTISAIALGKSWAWLDLGLNTANPGRLHEGYGSRHHSAKLTEDDVRKIRKMLPVITRKEIADIFDVSVNSIDAIVNKETWSWLK